jgi:hypothetical protein
MGFFNFGKSKSNSSSQQTSETFVDKNQQPFLTDLYGQAQALNSEGMPVEGVAGINPALQNAMNVANQGGQMQAGAGAGVMAQGAAATTGTGQALNYAGNAMGGNAGAGINTAMGAGNSYAGGAANVNAANNGGVNMGNVGGMINNNVLNGQIDAASRDVMRNLQENQLTGIASQAAGTGNSGSSRAGVMAGIAARGAGDRIGDIASQMRGQAYNTALNIGANQASQNAGFQQQSNMANQNAYNSARQFGTGVGQNAYNTNQQNQQFGAGMAQQIGQQGVNNMMSGQNMMNTGIGMAQGAGQMQRDYDQSMLNYDYRQGMAPYESLDFYSGIVGAPNNQTYSQATSKGSKSGFNLGFGSKE